LRLKGKGLPQGGEKAPGDLFARLSVTLPDPPEPKLEDFVRNWDNTHDPRQKAK
jgi:hypothetical protein